MITEVTLDTTIRELFDTLSFPSEPQGLYEPLKYMISIGGKRIRPRLCLIAYSLFKDSVGQEILNPAAALEVFHTFTLIHDDIMDRSPLRRGQLTVWKKWNEDTAILSGDVMQIDSYKRVAGAPAAVLPQVLELFSTTAAQVCEGQQYDMDFENRDEVSLEQYERMIGLKTAVLLACSAKMGALVGGASPEQAQALYQYGYELGMAFQIADDYLDTYGDEKVFGKPIGGDIANNKKTWLLINALRRSDDRQPLLDAMQMPSDTPEQRAAKVEAVKSIYNRLGIDTDAKLEIKRFSDKALEALGPLELDDEQFAMLRDFEEKLVSRAK